MEFESYDGYKQVIDKTMQALGNISRTDLASYLGVSERSINTWEKMRPGDETPKSRRVKLLYDVLKFISENYPEISVDDYNYLLQNGRITFDPNDEEDGSISLLNMILTSPDQKYWVSCVHCAVKSFKG